MPTLVTLPEGYRPVEAPGAWGFARAGAAGWAEEVLGSGVSLHAWAAGCPGRRGLTGRGRTWAVPAPASGPGEHKSWVARHYRRGGAVARFLRDRYLRAGEPRPLAELRASLEASRRGIPTPAVVAGAVYPAGAFYRADLVTEEIPAGVDLAYVLFRDPVPAGTCRPVPDPEAALAAAGALLRLLAEAGVRHPDLNAKNIVLEPRPDGVRAWLVDLDGCRFVAGGRSDTGGAMRRRLARSLRKMAARSGRPLGRKEWAALDAGPVPGERSS